MRLFTVSLILFGYTYVALGDVEEEHFSSSIEREADVPEQQIQPSTELPDEAAADLKDQADPEPLPTTTDLDELDDRSLLEVFGEAAKDYLTHKVIPDTDAECRWDWRSLRCEPACDCRFKPQQGDYHFGRACRRREQLKDFCEDIDPRLYLKEKPVVKRTLSLITQSLQLTKDQLVELIHVTKDTTKRQWAKIQGHEDESSIHE